MASYSIIESEIVTTSERWDAEFFQPRFSSLLSAIKKNGAVTLGTLATHIARGVAPPYSENGNVPVVRTVNVRDLEFSDARREFVEVCSYDNTPDAQIRRGDLAITSTGVGTLGRVFANVTNDTWFADGHISVVRLTNPKLAPFLAAVLQSQIGQWQFEQRQRGSSGQIEIYPEDISALLIPNLSDSLVTRIASLWSEAVRRVAKARTLHPEAELLERLGWEALRKKPVELFYVVDFCTVAGSARTDAEHFQPRYARLEKKMTQIGSMLLGALIEPITNGFDCRDWEPNGTPYIRVGDVANCQISDDCGRVRPSWAEIDKSVKLKIGDVLFTRKGTFGRAAVVTGKHVDWLISSEIMRLRLKASAPVLPDYLALYFCSPIGFEMVEKYVHGVSNFSISQADMMKLPIFLPRNKNGTVDLEWQERLAAKVQASTVAEQKARQQLEEAKLLVEEALKSARN